MTATQGNHTEVIGSPNYGDSRFHCSNPNTATPFTLSQTSPVVIEIIANFSDGPLTSAPSGGTYVSDAIVMGFQSFNPNPSVCNQNVYSISDPLRPPGSLTLQDVVNAGWLTVPSTLLLQPTAADSAEFGLSPCPYAP